MCRATSFKQRLPNIDLVPDGDLCCRALFTAEPVEPGLIIFFASVFLKQDRTVVRQTMRPCFIVLLPSPGWTKKKQHTLGKKNPKQTCIDFSNAGPVTATFMASFICRAFSTIFKPQIKHISNSISLQTADLGLPGGASLFHSLFRVSVLVEDFTHSGWGVSY